jgi:hypothetical protein
MIKDKRKSDVNILEVKEELRKLKKDFDNMTKDFQNNSICNSNMQGKINLIEEKINLIYSKLIEKPLLEEINTMKFQIEDLWKKLNKFIYIIASSIATLFITMIFGIFKYFTK